MIGYFRLRDVKTVFVTDEETRQQPKILAIQFSLQIDHYILNFLRPTHNDAIVEKHQQKQVFATVGTNVVRR